jgi:hypothetical protein
MQQICIKYVRVYHNIVSSIIHLIATRAAHIIKLDSII